MPLLVKMKPATIHNSWNGRVSIHPYEMACVKQQIITILRVGARAVPHISVTQYPSNPLAEMACSESAKVTL